MATALIVIDMQQDMADRTQQGIGRTNPMAEAAVAGLLARARAAGVPVVHVHHDDPNPAEAIRLDRPGGQPMACAAPVAGEAVVVKHGSSGFAGTELDQVLAQIGARRLVVAGAVLGFCVSSTVRDAQGRGYGVDLVEDATLCFDLPDGAGGMVPAQTIATVELTVLGLDFARRLRASQVDFGRG